MVNVFLYFVTVKNMTILFSVVGGWMDVNWYAFVGQFLCVGVFFFLYILCGQRGRVTILHFVKLKVFSIYLSYTFPERKFSKIILLIIRFQSLWTVPSYDVTILSMYYIYTILCACVLLPYSRLRWNFSRL